MHIFSGFIGVVVGFLIIKYSVSITETLGRVEWAEQHLRGGLAGTYSFYRIIGVVIIVLSLLYMFGGIGFIVAPLAGVFGGASQ
ncbi:MAG: hypothetical protein A3J07_04945 [Candidatus Doudnabacteria bacterium RIFCSPLOWO2_02_FULL_49_13]|uniref:Uncharacterized protein n=1 Tax=Candidatus Doudnabacteria bacterium RIFCSPHIGHO2_12_FULL_48_16 TaxID=1817838 RepID=A0A1F5PKJ5_9BACT|nr:MAG: hypothetical protein A3B77_04585 [Candidatus Doudnabacteria bacterium RIFCSPHIGHO2_02_FULL_49_24]OGE88166.1 MAG: hypothetical protein A2760_02235 [Candidatus Doudnabacteria bacterium RIFCSPHIGHO2_01_FULL_50_67]OGE90475.1 MAG: hypothetical protein A3E29_05015 [Candidatus Doudnabacteria bacterium RIFCSPHIGHO2_12_FULL_48_16]OGE96537.1 MAG: hypothetical protein A2990_03460 [Candidatus Doudnabacteria bacterium RIFCSPLOWO2_01_FULL_49_40]OGF02711.1 MAG: hypothetical protein A3J07_04945 [Candid